MRADSNDHLVGSELKELSVQIRAQHFCAKRSRDSSND
jgi:hypothetical protein